MRRGRSTTGIMEKAEKFIMRLVILTAVLLVVVQALVVNDPFRTVTAMVGADTAATVNSTSVRWSEPHITLYLENYSALPRLSVLVNGDKAGQFNHRYVTIPVHDGDVVEIDGSFYNREVIVRVLNTTGEVVEPVVDKQLRIKGQLTTVSTVKLKRN
ncbi:hypothetical protein JOC37_001044 [Desulfohalotomaculum tongense]|uniref:hypothetical protein n=1 Tax=Desulforadius tongensis TaxID=1216062 RepID=UPI001956C402|nr:hypothetical protein [Desulforadius tongensis]MBM7854666.1 hypothetical protein [Desulforadius tongensis]